MYFLIFLSLATAAIATVADSRFILYYDQWHTKKLPTKSLTAGVTHVMMSFANSSLFVSQPQGEYRPFQPVEDVRALFDSNVQVCMAIGGWGDTIGFSEAAKSDKTRKNFAKNIASTVDMLGFDCVDIDWEYPGGNGDDYKSIPNKKKEYEIQSFPRLLGEVKKAIGDKELSIAVPGHSRDMIAYTSNQVPEINRAVDFVNVGPTKMHIIRIKRKEKLLTL
ncbi:related to class V chitinase [Fusarium mangiferae]|uniref:Related to class V chitinase n=1 Tax=Fusarium mangiferae TaxID=192010 RepID=A0A1L7UF71_FUSMA|nr:uncharacterized protein FMAN_15478 [Fusarium mangiferae]CVL09314.1 related to class V chitinase [Fusarium mangiferae]